jgi:hypothetical protein
VLEIKVCAPWLSRVNLSKVDLRRCHWAPAIDFPDCPLIDAASYVLGGSDVSRLQRRLKEKEGVVNAIGASAYTPIFEGIFEVSAAAEPDKSGTAAFSIARELVNIMGAEPPAQQEVDRARAASQWAESHREEIVDGVARAIVSGLSTSMKDKFEGTYDHRLNEFEISELPHAMHRDWNLNEALIVALCDKNSAPSTDELIKQFKAGVAFAQHTPVTKTRQAARPAALPFISLRLVTVFP